MELGSFTECREYLRDYGIRKRFGMRKIMNNKVRQEYCISMSDNVTFRLKRGEFKHTCQPRGLENALANIKLVAQKIPGYVRDNHDCNPKAIRIRVKRKYKVNISYWTAWHARWRCLEMILGSFEDSYAKVPELCEKIKEDNPGSIDSFSRDSRTKQFTGLCVAYNASIEGYNDVRPMIGLDDFHSKGKYGGVIMSATALDGNGRLIPLAVYFTRLECKETWDAFLEIITPSLRLHDKQFGDVNHFHRLYFRHHYKNMKMKHPGPEWLLKHDLSQWTRWKFDKTSTCEH
ncbi:hypothetical protein MKX03_029021 [Papaver bracteatum]|nr:hypothetical protein MKX03_029021 [Papaver bracteatum]